MHIRLAALTFGLLWLVGGASAQSVEPKQKAPKLRPRWSVAWCLGSRNECNAY